METNACPNWISVFSNLPTRWGNYLNGNLLTQFFRFPLQSSPHSLGKLFEWKLRDELGDHRLVDHRLPTRWGN